MNDAIAEAIKNLYGADTSVVLTRPESRFGDYATNIALQLAKQLAKNPREVAEEVAAELRQTDMFKQVDVAGPGFINLWLSDEALLAEAEREPARPLAGQTVVAEYSDPNPFKVLHAGHLYTTIVGDAIARLLEAAGADVHRVNFGGDVGRHVARNMWAIIKNLGGILPEKLNELDEDFHVRSAWLSARYVEGTEADENDESAKNEITELNKQLYELIAADDHESALAKIYWTCREWSYEYFKLFYNELGVVQFEKYYPESVTTPTGVETVKKGLENGVYEMSDGAVVFKAEKYGLHTRVFINSEGLPTYEAKDVGLIMQKWRDYNFDKSIIITGNDIQQYMKVVQKSIEQFEPELVARSVHLTHGNLKLAGGKKMSSRKGTVLLALDVLEAAREAQAAQHDNANEPVVLGAVKYAFLSNRIGGDIVYDPETSVSLHGNSGPYLQYAHARACSIAAKSSVIATKPEHLDESERELVQKLSESPESLEQAAEELMPHLVCNYLYELAQAFNRFYEKSRIIGDEREAGRLYLLNLYRETLARGLNLLGISAPEKM
ncbi:MAG TPA: arginine--tRNA ligase [Candidatus Saccharibacteria bacterium]|nr:arginine--tRNA ligase [Candidatus Saccharibacteria bacterium]HRK94062.1 arginine--tRNA ligase [Candidatus Saccharibacteria bacterium]